MLAREQLQQIRMTTIHVPQRDNNDCAVAAAAMVARSDYETASRAASTLKGARATGIPPENIRLLVDRLTNDAWAYWEYQPWPFHGLYRNLSLNVFDCNSADPMLFVIAKNLDGFTYHSHAVVLCGGLVYDGRLTVPIPLQSYPNGSWVVHAIICPKGSRILRKAQMHKLYYYSLNIAITSFLWMAVALIIYFIIHMIS